VFGGQGNDSISGGADSDILDGGAGDDLLYADAPVAVDAAVATGNMVGTGTGIRGDWLAGGEGNDTLVGSTSNDVLSGGGGADLLIAGAGDDNIFGDTDWIASYFEWIATVSAYFHPVYGTQFPADGAADVIYAGEGQDRVWGGIENDVIFGEGGNDKLYGEEGNDIILGGAGADWLYGDGGDSAASTLGNDYLDGGADIDVIFGGAGDDIIIGGEGNDFLYGGAGQDTYIFNRGDGNDTIYDIKADNNIFRFGVGISQSDIKLRLGSLMLDVGNGDAVHIKNMDENGVLSDFDRNDVFNSSPIDSFAFADGTTLTHAELLARGFDIDGTDGDDILNGTNTVDRITGRGGNDVLIGGQGADILTGGAGNDYLMGDAGNDVYVFNRGDGKDTIDNTDLLRDTINLELLGAVDTLRFGVGVADTDVIGWRSEDNLVLKIKGSTDQVVVANYYAADVVNGTQVLDHKLDRIEFASGVVWDQAMIQTVVDRAASNHAPTVLAGLPALQARDGSQFSYVVPAGSITDPDIGDTVTYSATMANGDPLPAWLHFDAVTRTFSGAPATSNVGSLQFVLWGTDSFGVSAGVGVSLSVGPNVAPVALLTNWTYETAGTGQAFTYNAADMFIDAGDTLTYRAFIISYNNNRYTENPLPSWLVLDTATGVFSGTPPTSAGLGTSVVTMVATDHGNLSASSNFYLAVVDGTMHTLDGTEANDTIQGGPGFKTINGLGGNDYLVGGVGNDVFNGGAGDDTLRGFDGDDVLDGGAGRDTLSGEYGNDTYIFGKGYGHDSIKRENTTNAVDTLQLTADVAMADVTLYRVGVDLVVYLNASDTMDVKNYFEELSGYRMNIDRIRFADGTTWNISEIDQRATTLVDHPALVNGTLPAVQAQVGGAFSYTVAADFMIDPDPWDHVWYSFTGPSWMHFDSDTRIISGTPGETDVGKFQYGLTGSGVIFGNSTSVFSYTVNVTPIPNLTLIGTANADTLDGGAGHDTLNGLAGNDVLNGFAGNDTLDGGTGNDTMGGGLGNDTYVVDSISDVVREAVGEGVDLVQSSVTYSLTINVENLTLTGTTAINGTGNDSANVLTGNNAVNTLTGGAGDDRLDGLTGADKMLGGLGNDTYVVDNIGDLITENLYEGNDAVQASVTYTLAANVENLTLTGTAAINGIGNLLDNVLTGNGAANTLNGGSGADTMIGGAGNDTYTVDNVGDVITEMAVEGIDLVQASISYTLASDIENLTLIDVAAINGTGNVLDNILTGNSGINILTGGAGNDTYIVGAGDTTVELAGDGIDTVQSAVAWTLAAEVENLTLIGSAAINGTGNASDNTLIGNSAINTLTGGTGNDTYVVGAGDITLELAGGGSDTVQSAVTWILATEVENLTLTGASAISGTGNLLDNVLTGNSAINTLTGGDGNDTLDGGLGADKLLGGAGNDTYLVDNTAELITENLSAGIDLVLSSATYILAANVENLTLIGSTAINGTGNLLNNVLTGNSAANILNGGTGADTLIGGTGNDTYAVDNIGDVVIENFNEGTDLVQAGVTYSLDANIENLTLTGSTSINATGNELDNVLTGNTGINAMTGGAGNDTYIVAAGDTTIELAGGGIDTVQTSIVWTLAAEVENLTLTGTAAVNGNGNTVDNILTGNSAVNTLSGGEGKDTILAGAGNDILVGGAGKDTLTGGAGADIFDFNLIAESGIGPSAYDVITDFLAGTDRIDLVDIDANFATSGDQAFVFIGTGAFTAAGQLRYSFDGTNTLVQGNVDATLGVDFEILLTGNVTLVAANFIL
jgi:trimeric autotransporter adhesin